MIRTTIFPGRYVQGPGALQRLGTEMARLAENAFVICSPYVHEKLLPGFRESWGSDIQMHVSRFERECCDAEITRLVDLANMAGSSIVAGVGGGKTLDTAKAVAHQMHVPAVTAPTIASTDAPCSALSVIYSPKGEFDRYLFLPSNPAIVLVDTAVVATAPVELLVAGMGDGLATWFEAESCRVSYRANMTGDLGSMTAYALARLCYDTLLEYGLEAKASCAAGVVSPALEHVVEANTLLSGLGFESGGLATAHAIHNGLTALEATHKYSHGFKVAIGVQASMFLTDKPAVGD